MMSDNRLGNSWPKLEDCTSEIYSPEDTDGMTNWQAFRWHCARFWRWVASEPLKPNKPDWSGFDHPGSEVAPRGSL